MKNEEPPDNNQQERSTPDEHRPEDPSLRAAVGQYRKKRRIGWYVALLVLGFGIGAALALVVGQNIEHTENASEAKQPASEARPASAVRSGLVFSTTTQAPKETPDMFAAGLSEVYCHFRIPGVDDVSGLSGRCYRDGDIVNRIPGEQFEGSTKENVATGFTLLKAPSPKGFEKGIYEVDVTTPAGVTYSGSFVVVEDADKIAGEDGKALTIQKPVICAELTEEGAPGKEKKVFRPDVSRIYLAFSFKKATPGQNVYVQWYFHDSSLPGTAREVTLPSKSGWAHAWLGTQSKELLPPGSYRAIVRSQKDGEPLASASFEVQAAASEASE